MREKVKEMQVENKRDYVVIDDNVYPKTNIKKIANEIFLKCNYYNKTFNLSLHLSLECIKIINRNNLFGKT